MTSQRPFLLLKISFPGRPIFIQLAPGYAEDDLQGGSGAEEETRRGFRSGPRGFLQEESRPLQGPSCLKRSLIVNIKLFSLISVFSTSIFLVI